MAEHTEGLTFNVETNNDDFSDTPDIASAFAGKDKVSDTEAVEKVKTLRDRGEYTMKLNQPIEYGNVKYTELRFNFSTLTGVDIENVERELRGLGGMPDDLHNSPSYLRALASRAGKYPPDLLRSLYAPDYDLMLYVVKLFFQLRG